MIQYRALWLLIHGGRLLPDRVLFALARAGARIAWWASPARRRALRRRIARVHAHRRAADAPAGGWPTHDPARDARRAQEAVALYWADLVRSGGRGAQALDELAGGEGIHHLFDALDRGDGVVVVSAHLGNPEFLLRPLGAIGIPLFVFTERLEPPPLHELVHATRAAPNVRLEPLGMRAVRGALEHLRCGGLVALLGDRDLTGGGQPVSLFGAETTLPTGPVDLALRSGAPLLPAFVLRERPGRYRALVLPEIELDRKGDRRTATRQAMEAVARALETAIARDPGQWFGAAHEIWPEPADPAPGATAPGER